MNTKEINRCSVTHITGQTEIANLFQRKYDELYNSVSYNTCEMDTLMNDINVNIIICDDLHVYITPDEVLSAINQLKSRKNDGSSGHCTDHLINGTHMLYSRVSFLFKSMLSHGFAPLDFRI